MMRSSGVGGAAPAEGVVDADMLDYGSRCKGKVEVGIVIIDSLTT